MTREDAIAIIRKEYLCVDRDCDIERSCGKCDLVMPDKEPIIEAYKMAIKALEQDPNKWIPVSERLPEEDGEYLVTTINGDVDIYVFHTWGAKSPKVIAWQPKPQPYKEESEE